MTLKILYDYQIFEQEFGGISNSFAKHIENSRNSQDIEIKLPIHRHKNIHLKEVGFNANSQNNFGAKAVKKIIGKKRYNKYIRNINQNLIKEDLKEQNFDIFRPTYYDPYFLDFIADKPFVIDLYDMTHEIFPEFFSLKDDVCVNKKILAKRATKIITVSQNTKRDLVQLLDIKAEKIEVIYPGNIFEGINIDNISDAKIEKQLPQNYILFVGNRSSYKNFYFFITAIQRTLLGDDNLKLVCVGPRFNKAEVKFIENLNLAQKIIHVEVLGKNDLAIVYKKAKVFAFPSLYEGFGLPTIEAFSCSCPVVASNTSSIPEVAENAAIYFDPKNYDSIKSAVEKVLYNNDLRLELISNGLKRLPLFSWEENARKTVNLYKNLLANRDCQT